MTFPAAVALTAAGCWSPAPPVDRPQAPAPTDEAAEEDRDPEAPPGIPTVAEAGWFLDRTVEAGVAFQSPAPLEPPEALVDLSTGGGGVLADLTGDGRIDLLLTAPFGPNRLYVNVGEGRFVEQQDSGLEEWGHTYGAAAADLDDDGLREVFLFEREGARVFRNLGDARFLEEGWVYQTSDDESSVGGTLADLDGDGRVDLVVSMQGRDAPGDELQGRPNRLLLGRGGLRFEDRTEGMGKGIRIPSQTYASTVLDADGDGDLDLYFANDHGARIRPNELYRNDGGGRFSEVATERGLDVEGNGMGVAAGDLDGDGAPELVLSDTGGRIRVVSIQDGYGVDVTESIGAVPTDRDRFSISWGPELADLDHDGRLDLVVAWGAKGLGSHGLGEPQGISVWLNNASGRLEDVSGADPIPSETWRTAMVGDIDGDGTLDVVHSSFVGPTSIRSGRTHPDHHWLEVALIGPPGNRDGLGARVEIRTASGEQFRRIHAGGSGVHSSVEPVAHFGLGMEDEVLGGHVEWPDGSWSDIEVDEVDGRMVVAKTRE